MISRTKVAHCMPERSDKTLFFEEQRRLEYYYRGMHLTPEAPTYSMRAHGGLPAYAGGV